MSRIDVALVSSGLRKAVIEGRHSENFCGVAREDYTRAVLFVLTLLCTLFLSNSILETNIGRFYVGRTSDYRDAERSPAAYVCI